MDKVSVVILPSKTIQANVGDVRYISEAGTYLGPYEVTPSSEEQILSTSGLLLTGNIRINPVPSNYGRVDWNGSYITVS